MGHTHKPKIVRKNGVLYINTGAWTDKNAQAVIIDTAKKQAKLFDFYSGKPEIIRKVKI